MKKFLLAGAAAVFCAPAFAADMPVKAPPPLPGWSWTGCYVGGHGGYGWRDSQVGQIDIPTGITVTIGAQEANTNRFVGGLQGGCNWQPGQFVVGIEGDLWWSRMRENNYSTSIPPAGNPNSYTSTLTSKNLWDADLTLRLGLPVNTALLYVKGGGAYGSFSYSDNGTYGIALNNAFAVSGNAGRWGWIMGGGLEYALSKNWSAKIEYDYVSFGSGTMNYSGTFTPLNSPAVPTSGRTTTKETEQIVKVGVNYLFGGPR